MITTLSSEVSFIVLLLIYSVSNILSYLLYHAGSSGWNHYWELSIL
jgi:hypothetical protein